MPKAKQVLRKLFEGCVLRPTASFRRLPDFVVIGAQKSGTSSLMEFINSHPEVKRAWKKEIHYFDHHYDKGIGFYQKYFPIKFQSKAFVSGEASPYYLAHPLSAMRLRETLPGIPLLAILRHPVDRAISHYYHNIRVGGRSRENESFKEALQLEEGRISGEEERLTKGEVAWSPNHVFFSYQARGNYYEQLLCFEEELTSGKLKVLFFEEMCEASSDFARDLFEHIGISSDYSPEFPKANAGMSQRKDVDAGSIEKLLDYYAEPNRRLFELLGRECEFWKHREDFWRSYVSQQAK